MTSRFVPFQLSVLFILYCFIYCLTLGGGLTTAAAQDEGIDSDGDGIADDLDTCPEQAEDFDGFEDQDGCPEEAAAPLCGDVTGDNRVKKTI